MESNLETFIEQLKDWQLAYFYKYRFNEFMPDSKEKILNEFQKRNLSINNIEQLIANCQKENEHNSSMVCQRCKSSFFFYNKEKMLRSKFEIEQDVFYCQVCGYKKDDKPKGFWRWVTD